MLAQLLPGAGPLLRLELTHRSPKSFPVHGDGGSSRWQWGKPFKP
jgi:hypothetical protein